MPSANRDFPPGSLGKITRKEWSRVASVKLNPTAISGHSRLRGKQGPSGSALSLGRPAKRKPGRHNKNAGFHNLRGHTATGVLGFLWHTLLPLPPGWGGRLKRQSNRNARPCKSVRRLGGAFSASSRSLGSAFNCLDGPLRARKAGRSWAKCFGSNGIAPHAESTGNIPMRQYLPRNLKAGQLKGGDVASPVPAESRQNLVTWLIKIAVPNLNKRQVRAFTR